MVNSLIMMIVFFIGVLLLLSLQPKTTMMTLGMKMRRAKSAQESLAEFIKTKKNRWGIKQYYIFSEENVRSLGHRFVGRFDSAILHWEDSPVLDAIIEYKFPVKHIPKIARPEDVFQSGLYALALLESGVSCSSAKLVTIYCPQEIAMSCLDRKSTRDCWRCGSASVKVTRFKPKSVLKKLQRLDEVWYNGRVPNPTQEPHNCRVCPYSNGRCNYSLI